MFLEAQFGADNVNPIAEPKLPPLPKAIKDSPAKKEEDDEEASMEESSDEEEADRQLEKRQHAELERLHKLGIPVPGVSVKVGDNVATVWLEDLEVECTHRVLGDRVRVVVERAVEVGAPLWG